MHSERLELVCKDLDTDPPFYFGLWVGKDWKGAPGLSCGTTACALGRATTIPELQALGLRLVRSPDSSYSFVCFGESPEEGCFIDEVDISIGAAMAVFDITRTEAEYLFLPRSQQNYLPSTASAGDLAQHIRAFIERGGMP